MSDGTPAADDRPDLSLDVVNPRVVEDAGPTQRVRLGIAYEGTDFAGWAVQPGMRTVQDELQRALATVLRVPDVRLTVAGRTDAGVHATGQVAHVDVAAPVDNRLLERLAGVLPADVRVHEVTLVPDAFEARFGALWRRYEYRISDDPAGVSPLRRRFVLARRRALDVELMQTAATGLLGLQNFAAFCKRREIATTIRTLERFEVARVDGEIVCTLQADAFCHSMVRSLVGALIAVGDGRQPVGWPAELLTRTERSERVVVAAALGLTLVEVGYPPLEELAARARITRARRG